MRAPASSYLNLISFLLTRTLSLLLYQISFPQNLSYSISFPLSHDASLIWWYNTLSFGTLADLDAAAVACPSDDGTSSRVSARLASSPPSNPEVRRGSSFCFESDFFIDHGKLLRGVTDKELVFGVSRLDARMQIQIYNLRATRPTPLEVLKHVKMNYTRGTPCSTIKGFLNYPMQTELKFSRENLKKVEDKLKLAFVEFYQKLRLLRSYSFLNTLAFSKIMKKYDKITSRNAAKSYMKMVDNSFLGSSDEVTKLMERVEATFIKHFSNSNRTKAMNILRPKVEFSFEIHGYAGLVVS